MQVRFGVFDVLVGTLLLTILGGNVFWVIDLKSVKRGKEDHEKRDVQVQATFA